MLSVARVVLYCASCWKVNLLASGIF